MYNDRNNRDNTMELRVPGYPDYGVNDEGYVFSYKRGKRTQLQPGLAGKKNDERYYVVLHQEGKAKTCAIHRLVLETFHPKPNPELVTRHLNGDRLDNRLCNLQWGTRTENQIDTSKHGNHPVRKLSDQDVRDIRVMLSTGTLSHEKIAEKFGVCRKSVSAIKSGKTFNYIQ